MADYDKFDFENIESIYSNNEGFRGGFFPIGEFNFWHGGIHLKGGADRKTYITPVEDGEIIAYRLTEEYCSYSNRLPQKFRKFEVNEAKSRANKEELEVLESSLIADRDNAEKMVLRDNATDEEKELLKHIFNSYSNNFVLLKHTKKVLEKDIIFYSLYMHLEVWNNYPKYSEESEQEGEVIRPFFQEWKYEVTGDETGPGLKLSTGEIVHPYVWVKEVLNDDKNNVLIEDEDPDRIKVKVLFHYDKSGTWKEGFISLKEGNNVFLEPMWGRDTYKIKKDTKVYYDKEKTALKGKIKKETSTLKIEGEELKYPRIKAKVEVRDISFSEGAFTVNEIEGYILNDDENALEKNNNTGRYNVKVDSIQLYELDKAAEEIKKIEDEGEGKANIKKLLSDFTIEDDTITLKVYKNDILEVAEVEDDEIKKHFPNAKKIKRKYTDGQLGPGRCKGWIDLDELIIDPVYYRVLAEPVLSASRSGSSYTGIDEDNKGIYYRVESRSKGRVKQIIKQGAKVRLKETINHIDDLRTSVSYFTAFTGDSNLAENIPFYVKGNDFFENTNVLKELNSDFKLEASGNNVNELSEPMLVNKNNTILGAVGKTNFQNEVFHFELFLKDDTFMKLEAKDNKKKNFFFKKGNYLLKEKKTVKEIIDFPVNGLLKIVESEEDSDIIKVETYCNPPDFVYVKYSTLGDHEAEDYNYSWVKYYTQLRFTDEFGECDVYSIKMNNNTNKLEVTKKDNKGLKLKGQIVTDADQNQVLEEGDKWYGDSAYWKLELFTTIESSSKKTGYLLKSKLPSGLKFYEGGYYELTKSGIEWYKEDPTPFEPGRDVTITITKETVIRSVHIKEAEHNGKKWLGFEFSNGKSGWIKEEEVVKFNDITFENKVLDDNVILDLYNVNNFFKVVKETDTNKMKDGICDVTQLLDMADVRVDNSDFLAFLQTLLLPLKSQDEAREEAETLFKPGVIYEAMNNPVKEDYRQMRLVDYLRRMICKLPIEWEDLDDNSDKKEIMENRLKDVPYLYTKTQLKEYKRALKNLSWFGKVKEKLDTDSNMFYFVHPATFLKQIRSLNSEFNPFKDKEIVHHYSTSKVKVLDNPGFGVVADEKLDILDSEKYHGFTGAFNEDYTEYYKRYWIHEGIDFRGAEGAPIMSFITGKVIISGEYYKATGYGLLYVIQNINNPTHFYLLAHMSAKNKVEGDMIYPGEIIGYSGNTGTKYAHLHISLFKLESEDYEDIVEDKGEGKYNIKLSDNKDKIINPVNHDDLWSIEL